MSIRIILILIIGLALCDKSSVDFYYKAFQGNLGSGIDFVYNDKNKYLKNNEDLTPDKLFANIPRELSFSSCDFFPLKDYFADILAAYYNEYKPKLRYDLFINRYVLVFHMMFYKRGNYAKVEQYYKAVHPDYLEDNFINFKTTEIKKDYLNNIPLHTYSKPIYSSIYYSGDNLQNAEKLGHDVTEARVANHLFDYLYNRIEKEENKEIKVIILYLGISKYC
jgi:hypothetical protein